MARRVFWRSSALALTLAGGLALAGCGTSSDDAAAPTSTPSPSPTPVELLTCDSLVDPSLVTPVLTFADGAAPAVVPAVQPNIQLNTFLVPQVGGLSCSWRNGPQPTQPVWVEVGAAYLGVDVLPAGGAYFADGVDDPVEPSVEIAGVPSVSTCGSTGCVVAGVVDDSWVRVWMHTSGWQKDYSPYEGIPDRQTVMLTNLAALAADLFTTLADSPPEAYAWPVPEPAAPVTCDDLSAAVGPGGEPWGYGRPRAADPVTTPEDATSFHQAVWYLAGGLTCHWREGYEDTFVVVVPGAASVIERLAQTPDQNVLFTPTQIPGADLANQFCFTTYCVTQFSKNGNAYETSFPAAAAAIAAAPAPAG